MVAVGNQGDVPVVDLAAQVDGAAGAAVGAVQAKSLGALGAVFDLEVVDFFELALVLGVLLVLVGRVGGPVGRPGVMTSQASRWEVVTPSTARQ